MSDTHAPDHDVDALLAALREFEGQPARPPRCAPDGVDATMIRHWCEALGDTNERYRPGPGQVAPPAMLQVWCMLGLEPPPTDTPLQALETTLRDHGYVGVVATNCTQTYARDLRPGEPLREERTIEAVSDLKHTALGDGFFVTTRSRFFDDADEQVAEMEFRVLRFRPAATDGEPPTEQSTAERRASPGPADPGPRRPRPSITDDNRFFFDGACDGRLLMQRCSRCKEITHPPTPACPHCQSFEQEHVECTGHGTVFSFIVNHHPQVPGFEYPLIVAVVELEEGARLVTNLVDVEPDTVRVGLPVEVEFVATDDELTLPMFRPSRGEVSDGL